MDTVRLTQDKVPTALREGTSHAFPTPGCAARQELLKEEGKSNKARK